MRCSTSILLSMTVLLVQAQQKVPDWSVVPGALLRVDVDIDKAPDHPDLGVLAIIPDGGLLPGKFPIPDVRDAEGNPVESLIVGHNPVESLGVLFAQPKSGSVVHIFIKGSSVAPTRPTTRLFPSLMLHTKSGGTHVEASKRLAAEYPPFPGGFFSPWHMLGAMWNPHGYDYDYLTWFTAGILLEKKEKIYFATISNAGSEFWIDGKMTYSWPGVHTRKEGDKGQKGTWVELDEGLHRIDYYHFAGSPEVTKGYPESQLVWKRKGITQGELPSVIRECAKSGTASITSITYKDGREAATVEGNHAPINYFWTGEKPMILFTLAYEALKADSKAQVTWDMGGSKRLHDTVVDWVVPGVPDTLAATATLIVSNATGLTRSAFRMTAPRTPKEASIDSKSDRMGFRKAFYNLIRAVPKGASPVADWTPDHWQLLVELQEPYRSGPILMDLFNRGFDAIQKIPNEQRWALEDRFIETLRLKRDNPLLIEWIEKFEKNERNSARKFRWKDERVCAFLYDIQDPALAKREVAFLKEAAQLPDQAQVVALRQGDVERLLGNGDQAVKFYKDAQDRYRSRNKIGLTGGRLAFVDPAKQKARAEKGAAKTSAAPAAAPAKTTHLQSLQSQKMQKVDDWKIYTVNDASLYATVTSYLTQDAVAEAFQKLMDWENQSPLSKLSGDYPLAEAKVYEYVEDFRRVVNIASIYRKGVTMNAQLADMMQMEMRGLEKINDKPRMKALAEDFIKRFPGHPYEEDFKKVLAP